MSAARARVQGPNGACCAFLSYSTIECYAGSLLWYTRVQYGTASFRKGRVGAKGTRAKERTKKSPESPHLKGTAKGDWTGPPTG